MNTKNLLTVLAVLAVLAAPAMAYTPDGDLSDWGVTPFVDWVPDSPTAEYSVEDYDGTNPEPGGYPIGGENFDIEALYFDDELGVAYFAAVTSLGPDGLGSYKPGDLALDIDNDPSTGEYGYEYGIKLFASNGIPKGWVCKNPDWLYASEYENSPSYIRNCNEKTGSAIVVYTDAGVTDYAGVDLPNYIIEVKVNKNAIGSPNQDDTSEMHVSMSCGNDVIEIEQTWDYEAPEFMSFALPAIILLLTPGLAYYLSRKE